jgi:hypothetical protein
MSAMPYSVTCACAASGIAAATAMARSDSLRAAKNKNNFLIFQLFRTPKHEETRETRL